LSKASDGIRRKTMANVKNFGLEGVASSVQLGKGGATLQGSSSSITAMDPTGETLVNIRAADPQGSNDVVTLEFLQAQNGMDFQLGTPTDNGLASGAVPLTSSTTVTNAVDQLNEILGKLVPTAPANFPGGQTLSITGAGSALLASGAVPNNTGTTVPTTAGNTVSRITAATASSSVIGDNGTTGFVGPGNSGTVQAIVNGTVVDSQAMAGGTNKTSGVLRITNDNAYPAATPGFWYSFRAAINGASATQGWNNFAINDTASGTTATNNVFFVQDNITSAPVVSSGTVAQNAAGTLAYSSSVPHYNTGASLVASFNATNIAGETYSSGNILSFSPSAGGIFATQGFAAGAGGLPNPVARQTTSFAATNLPINLNATNVFASGRVTGSATNPNGTGSSTFGPTILVMNGTSGSALYELNVPVTIATNGGPSGNATRITMSNGNNPSDVVTLTSNTWTSSASINAWDATVVAGVLQNDVNNYSTYLPAGPNLSSHNATQYVTFMFQRTAVSKFNIDVVGSYAGMWVQMPGLTTQYTSTANGWYNMFAPYNGSGQPGDTNGANGSLGCALAGNATGSTGNFTCTFGTLSSTNSANNIILVRFALTAGQSITSLSFAVSSN
jgi:hypothetical protein